MKKERLYEFAIEGMQAKIKELRRTSRRARELIEEKRFSTGHKCKLTLNELDEIASKAEAEIKKLEQECWDLRWELALEE